MATKANGVVAPEAAVQLYRLAEAVPTDAETFRAAIFATRGMRARSWPRRGGALELRCPSATCLVGVVRLEVDPAPETWQRPPTRLLCPLCSDVLQPVRRLETVTLVPVPAAANGDCGRP
jgi:hypothetical protein